MSLAPTPAPTPTNWQGVRTGLESAIRHFQRSDYHQAKVQLESILEFAPMEARAWHMLGKVMQALGDHERALEYFHHASDLYDPIPSGERGEIASVTLVKLLWKQGDREGASAMLDKLLEQGEDGQKIRELARLLKEEV
jgi:tetratricopeptide (TPR) repeat protein